MSAVTPPWLSPLTDAEHTLVVYGLVVTGLALLVTIVRLRFAPQESHGEYRTASLTANAVVAIAFVSYVLVLAAVLAGYRETGGVWRPNEFAVFAWAGRYMDWTVTVPLLVVELVAISALPRRRASWMRSVGMAAAGVMVVLGFLGGVVIDGGRDFAALAGFGLASALCFAVLYAIVLAMLLHTLPRLPDEARTAYRSAVLLLIVVWFAYPIVFGIGGVVAGGAWAATSQLILCAADGIAKIGFGTLVHRTAVLRSRLDEEAQPGRRRPRQPEADSIWVGRSTTFESDPEHDGDDAANGRTYVSDQ